MHTLHNLDTAKGCMTLCGWRDAWPLPGDPSLGIRYLGLDPAEADRLAAQAEQARNAGSARRCDECARIAQDRREQCDAPPGRAARIAGWIEPALSASAVALLLAIFARYGSLFALGAAAVGALAFVLQVRSR